jgi:hypothetical protein
LLIRKKSDTTQFSWVTIDPTYKLTTGKLSVKYALFACLSIAVSDSSILNTRIKEIFKFLLLKNGNF